TTLALLVLCAAPARADRPAFMSSFEDWQEDVTAWNHAIALSPDGKNVYVGRDLSYYISRFDRDPVSGDLTFAGDVPSSFADYPLCEPIDGVTACRDIFLTQHGLAMSPDGRHLYAAI